MFVLPEGGVTALSDEDLTALRTQGEAAFTGLGLTEASDEATVTEAERIVAALREVKAEQGAREARRATAAALVAEMSAATEPEVEAAATDSVEASDEEPAAEPEAADEPEGDDDEGDDDEDEPVEAAADDAESTDEAPVTAAASTTDTPVERAARNAPAVIIPKEKAVNVLTAAADVPGFATGTVLDSLDQVAEGLNARLRAMPSGPASSEIFSRYGVAQVKKDMGEFSLGGNPADDQDLLDSVASEGRLPGGSLVAAGGWCAPTETLWDLCSRATPEGLLSLPEIGVPRGSVQVFEGVDYSTLYAGFTQGTTGWLWADGNQPNNTAGAGQPPNNTKPCVTVDCPAPKPYILDAIGLCIKAGILKNAAFPEYTRHYIENALIAYANFQNAQIIGKIEALLGSAVTVPEVGSLTATLDSLAAIIEQQRQNYRLNRNQALEVVAPFWLKAAIRSDLSRRTGVDLVNVTDAMINDFFAVRGAAVQYVYGLSEMSAANADAFKYPTSADLLVYPSGTFVKGTMGVISLDAVYDSTDLSNNVYTGLFMEEGFEVIRRCHGGVRVTLPICANGVTSANDLFNCSGTVATFKRA